MPRSFRLLIAAFALAAPLAVAGLPGKAEARLSQHAAARTATGETQAGTARKTRTHAATSRHRRHQQAKRTRQTQRPAAG